MPWEVVKVDGHKVRNKETGAADYSKKPQSRKRALAQMRAMYANYKAGK